MLKYSDSTPTTSPAHNRAGRQVRAEDAAGVTTFAYDDFGAVTNETVVGVAGTNTIERFYDNFGRDAGYALNGVRQSTLSYDSATGRLVTMLAAGSDTPFTWNYLVGSDLKSSLAYPNGLTASWQYDANGQLLQVRNATPTNTISQYDYTYDAAGRRVACGKSGCAFAQNDTLSYCYNEKSELTNAVAAVDSDYRYAYDFDDIGNRESSSERGTNSVYTANNLNQYTAVDDFAPQFDDDGNQTLVKTATGVWQVTYNGENRPVLWTLINSFTPNSSTPTLLSMSYDRMGRRMTMNAQRFVYNGYLQIANFELASTNPQFTTHNSQLFIWDPTEVIATLPLRWLCGTFAAYYTHDGNKNVSEVVASGGETLAHYEYSPFGALTFTYGNIMDLNPWRFSSEYADGALNLIYYTFRHYDPNSGRWITQDPIEEQGGLNLYGFCLNNTQYYLDANGLAIEFSWTLKEIEIPFPCLGPNWYIVFGNRFSGRIGGCCSKKGTRTLYLQAKWTPSLAVRYGYKDKLGIGKGGRLMRKDKNGRWHDWDTGRFSEKPISSLSDIYDDVVDFLLGNGRVSLEEESNDMPCPDEGFSGEVRGFIRGQASAWGYGSLFDLTWIIFPNGSWSPDTKEIRFGRVGGGTQFYVDAGAEGDVKLTHVME